MLVYPAVLWFVKTDFGAAQSQGTYMSPHNQTVILTKSQHQVIYPANPRSAFNDGIEHRLHICRRTTDDAQHFGRRGLMLQRLAQFGVTLAEFLEQPYVLDRDHCLRRKGLKQFDLLLRERTDLRPSDVDYANG